MLFCYCEQGCRQWMEWMPTPFLLENVPEKAEVQQIQIEFTGIAWSFSAREYIFYVFFSISKNAVLCLFQLRFQKT